jgi:prephenate dehydratase
VKLLKFGFLGPVGTFSEEALLSTATFEESQLVPLPTIPEVVMAVERREVDKSIVPIENSIEGSVNATLDMLAFESNLLIEKEVIRSVDSNLIGRRGTKKDQVKTIISHPQPSAQCRAYIMREFPGVTIEAANSTAEAVRIAKERGSRDVVAIGTTLAAKLYGLSVLDRKIQDFPDNRTRFVVIGREMAGRTGYDKTSIVCFIREDRPGSLLQILQEFAFRSINLTKIQSRPTRKALGEYCFFLDMEGHIEDENVADALKCLRCRIRQVKLLGSYPRARVGKA